jgi:hypothetical protein
MMDRPEYTTLHQPALRLRATIVPAVKMVRETQTAILWGYSSSLVLVCQHLPLFTQLLSLPLLQPTAPSIQGQQP